MCAYCATGVQTCGLNPSRRTHAWTYAGPGASGVQGTGTANPSICGDFGREGWDSGARGGPLLTRSARRQTRPRAGRGAIRGAEPRRPIDTPVEYPGGASGAHLDRPSWSFTADSGRARRHPSAVARATVDTPSGTSVAPRGHIAEEHRRASSGRRWTRRAHVWTDSSSEFPTRPQATASPPSRRSLVASPRRGARASLRGGRGSGAQPIPTVARESRRSCRIGPFGVHHPL